MEFKMKKILITILILCLFASFGMAQHKTAAHKGGIPLKGVVGYVLTWDGLKPVWAVGASDSVWSSITLGRSGLVNGQLNLVAIDGNTSSLIDNGSTLTILSNSNQILLRPKNTTVLTLDIADATFSKKLNLLEGLFITTTAVQGTYVIRKHVALSGASDASATNWFTITTTDETGSADGGMYSVHVHLIAGEATAASGAVNTASVSLIAHWTRIMASAGTGANSAVAEINESASADEGSGAISAVTITVTETSEFVQQVLLNVNTSGGTFDGFAIVELVYSDFTTAPVIN